MARTVQCVYLKREAEGLDFAPYPGELGKRIYASVSKEAWAAWMKHQTMLVNENRLNLADQRLVGPGLEHQHVCVAAGHRSRPGNRDRGRRRQAGPLP